MTEEQPKTPPSLELDGKLYSLEDVSDDGKILINHIRQANELIQLKETELVHLRFNRECGLEKLRESLADVAFTEKEEPESKEG